MKSTVEVHLSCRPFLCPWLTLAVVLSLIAFCDRASSAEFDYARDVKPLLTKYCVGCHGEKENESEIRLDSLTNIFKGGPNGKILVPKDTSASSLAEVLSSNASSKMPPKDSPQPSKSEIELIRRWIEEGARGSDEPIPLKAKLRVDSIPSKVDANWITAIGAAANDSVYVGRYNSLHLTHDQWSSSLPIDIVGKVTQIRSTADGRFTTVVSGVAGVGGRAIVLDNQSGASIPKVVRIVEGHRDTLYCGTVSPDGKVLATGGYDRVVMLWDVRDGHLLRKLEGHNGAIYDLDFDPTGKVIATASADETIKVWRVDSGERLDTFGQCEAEQYVVRFDLARNRVLAAGADRRIRVWNLLSLEKPTVSPMLYSVFAHEGPLTQFALSQDGKTLATTSEDKQIKLWDAEDYAPLGKVTTLEEYPSGLIWNLKGTKLVASTMGGQLVSVDVRERKAAPREKEFVKESSSRELRGGTVEAKTLAPIMETSAKRTIGTAQPLLINSQVTATLTDEDMRGEYAGDWYSFEAMAGETWVVQVDASRSGSPLDSLIDILSVKGEPILRTRLQAVRESYFTFRGKDSTNIDDFRMHRWEDMELNELLYAGGEVVKLWLYPRGPDSGFKTYPGFGNRFTYFDTTATTHALNEPAWIVRELKENESAIPNGLPVFPIYYTNDDDGNRKFGKDSSLSFTAPIDGKYLIRVRDARGQAGDKYAYKLNVARPNPRFEFRVEQKSITLRPGVGTEFSVIVDRYDGCDGDIQVQLEGVPEGIQVASPLVVEAGQHRAIGSLHSPIDLAAKHSEFKMQLSCRAQLGDQWIDGMANNEEREIAVKVSDKKAMPLKVVAKGADAEATPISELTIRPGQTISAMLVIERGELQGDIAFGGDDSGRNLPHGCFVDNIGLSGLLIPAGQSTREVFLTASPVTRPQTRLFHLRATVDGNPTTLPIRIHVVRD